MGGSYLCMVDDHRSGGGGYLCMVDDDRGRGGGVITCTCVLLIMTVCGREWKVRVFTCVWLMITVVRGGGGGVRYLCMLM